MAAAGPPGSAGAVLAEGVSFLKPDDAVLEAMLAGWGMQQAARLLTAWTVEQRIYTVRRFVTFTGVFPWAWTPADAERWCASMVEVGLAHSTVRNYQLTVASFLAYLCDARYEWGSVCEARFGTHPTQVFHEWNMATHRAEREARPGNRPLSRDELQEFFDYCDERVGRVERTGRKGWLAAYRDAVLFKTMYAWGLRRREVAMLDVTDWGHNARQPRFGRFGVVNVRYGKASRGSPPKQRTVLTVMGWAADAVREWVEEIRPAYQPGAKRMLWPTERGERVTTTAINARFAQYRDELGLDGELRPHCLRHSFVTHQLEDGADQLFVQQQVGHRWGSTTAGYTTVGSVYLQDALARALRPALEVEGVDG
jgi:site-specific recombinase XerD